MDKFYQSIKNDYTLKEFLEAGYINEEKNQTVDFNFPTTPLPLIEEFHTNKKNAILISTGSFAPIHEGHLEKLKIAKKHLENKNYHVVCAYLSPSHDEYVINQKIKNTEYNIFNRINWINKLLKKEENQWIKLDLWESLFNTLPINFTSVIIHIENLFNTYFSSNNFDIFYVYGSDNHAFGRVFKSYGKGICIQRNEHKQPEYANVINLKNDFYKNKNSTNIRKNKLEQTKIKKENLNNYICLLRDDLKRSLSKNVINQFSKNEQDAFVSSVKMLWKKYNKMQLPVMVVNEKEENKLLQKIDFEKIISLDLYHGENKKRISRLFQMNDYQHKPLCLYDTSNENFNIPKSCFIFDDDSVSGNTFRYFEKKYNTKIEKSITLADLFKIKHQVEIFDVADIRDFLFGSLEGGLLTYYGDKILKTPYIFPFINSETRLNINLKHAINFSLEVLNLNYLLYKNKPIIIEDFQNNDIIKLSALLNVSSKEHINTLLKTIIKNLMLCQKNNLLK